MVLALSGCSGVPFGRSDDITLKLVAADYGDKASNSSKGYWDRLARAFERRNPGIEVEVVDWNDIDAHVKTMLRGGDVPDLLQTGGYADKVADDLLYRADQVLSVAAHGNLIPGFAQAGEVDHVQYGIPFASSARAFFYNKAIFEQAGISGPPRTWAEVEKDAETLRSKAPGAIPYALPLGPEEAEAESLMWELGDDGGYTSSAGEYTLNSAADVETFTWLKNHLVKPGLTDADPATVNRKTAFADFAAGKAAMLNGHPSLVRAAEEGRVGYGVAAIPVRNGPLRSTLGVADWMMAFRKNGHREQIKKFLDFAYSEKDMLAFDEEYNLMPATQDALEAMRDSGRHGDLEPFFRMLPDAVFYPLGDPGWDAVCAEIKKSGGNAVHGDPAAVLGALQKTAQGVAVSR